MRFARFVVWFPVFWLLTVVGMFMDLVSFAVGTIAGLGLYGLIFGHQALERVSLFFIAFVLASGFIVYSLASKKWKSAIRRILERMRRDIYG